MTFLQFVLALTAKPLDKRVIELCTYEYLAKNAIDHEVLPFGSEGPNKYSASRKTNLSDKMPLMLTFSNQYMSWSI